MRDGYTEAELKKVITLRSMEWANWPVFLSPLWLPISLIWIHWWLSLAILYVANNVWVLFRYRLISFVAADRTSRVVAFSQWPIAIICFGILLFQKHYVLSVLALLWPVVDSAMSFPNMILTPAKAGFIEISFAKQMGLIKVDEESDEIPIWAPILKGNDQPTMSLAVKCGSTTPTQAEYRGRLRDWMEELVQRDSKQAWKDLEQVCDPRVAPDLCNIFAMYQVKDLAVQVTMSDQMNILLGRIDWEKENPPIRGTFEELPSLMDILQMV